MKLLLDIGNTAVKWACAEAGQLQTSGHFVHRNADFDALAGEAWAALPAPEAVTVSNVAGDQIAAVINRLLASIWGIMPDFVQVGRTACGVTNGYTEQQDLGADRWVAMIAAHRHHPGPTCIVDCGTAITIDLLVADGRHLGGLILPGTAMLGKLLQGNTAGIDLQGMMVTTLLGQATTEGVMGGSRYLVAAAIDRVVADMHAAAAGAVKTIITGGDAAQLLPLITVPVQHESALVLQGLAVLSDGEA